MTAPDAATDLLRQIGIVNPNESRLQRIAIAGAQISDWQTLIACAETHGLAPLLHRHLKTVEIVLPANARIMLAGLVARHRQATTTLCDTLLDIGQIYKSRQLPFICLKGIALAHIIYPQPSLRPMRDIDILVPRNRATEARDALVANGFESQQQHTGLADGRYMRHHHHLPEVSMMRNGMQVTIEIHTDALSGDSPEQLCLQTLSAPTRSFGFDNQSFQALGHTDMLTHLILHALEPAEEIKLGSICDIVSYADCFSDDIDFDELHRNHPRLTNALSMLHYVAELPASLSALQPVAPPPALPGYGMPPLSHLFQRHGYSLAALRTALHPPAWWVHAYYGVPPAQSPRRTCYTRHIAALMKWLFRRLRAGFEYPQNQSSSPAPIDATEN